MHFADLLWLVPVLPFAGAALNGLVLPRRKGLVTAIGVGAPGLSLVVALLALWDYGQRVSPRPFEQVLYTWTTSSLPHGLTIPVAFLLDPLSCVMLFVVTFVGFWIHVYSVGYMGHEEGYQRYFAYLNLFMGAMLLLVLGNNFLVTFVGWEGVGLCSYLLIGYYYDQEFPPYAGRKAFIVNRIGDFAFLIGLFALVSRFGTLSYTQVFAKVGEQAAELSTQPYLLGLPFAGFVALCLFVGAMGKSAQIPLFVWLPDAMAGPTPVSALIHAATMVTAGVYMVVRCHLLYALSPGVALFVAGIGAATALMAATIGLAQNDIKKVLAYSTVSQLGYMFLAAGVGAGTAAIFHLGTHAFFKALLFLGSGSVIHAMSGEQDMRKMGSLGKHLPVTYRTFLIATLAIAGIPPLAGFFSKDEILTETFAGGHLLLWVVGLLTAGLTACYMFRAVYLTFHGEFRGTPEQAHHLHESPRMMTVPLIVLAVGAVVAGWVGIPNGIIPGFEHVNWLHDFLAPVFADLPQVEGGEHEMGLGLEWALIVGSVLVALIGIGIARRAWRTGGTAADDTFAARLPGLHRLLSNKYYVDELYDRAIVKPLAAIARACWKVVDTLLIDGSLHVGAFVTELTGDLGRFSTTGNVRSYALYFFAGVLVLFWWMLFLTMAMFLDLLTSDSLTRLVFFPAIACLPLLFFRGSSNRGIKIYTLLVSLAELALTLLFVAGHWQAAGMKIRDLDPSGNPIAWVRLPNLEINYDLGMDGISLPLVVLTALLLPIVVLGSWKGITAHWQGFAASLLLLTTGILGALLALDLFVFYVFWEVMLVPMYLIIGIWGGERRIYAAVKFFLFTMAGSLLMLVAILWLSWAHAQASHGPWQFGYEQLLRLELPVAQQVWLFAAFALAFAIKVPMFPLHTWLPDAHVEAPTGGSVILAGVLLKLGTYGFLRFALPLFPHASQRYGPLLVALALIGIVYGALVSWVQPDMKKLIAYSSVAHLGFVMLGLLACDLLAWQGALLQMVNHGLSTGALFLLVGMLYDRRHTKKFEDFGGLAKVIPWFAFFLVFCTLASVGLPGLNGFVGEFLILVGSYHAGLHWATIVAAFGVVLAAVYLLRMLHETIWGPITKEENKGLADLDTREVLALLPLCALMLWIGIAPQAFLQPSEPALKAVLSQYQARRDQAAPQAPRLLPAGPVSADSAAFGIVVAGPSAVSELPN